MENRTPDAGLRKALLRKVSTLPAGIRVYKNKVVGNYEIWLRGVYVMDFYKLNNEIIKKLTYRFSQHNADRDTDKEIKDFEGKQKKDSKQFFNEMINEMATDLYKFGNRNAVSVSTLSKK